MIPSWSVDYGEVVGYIVVTWNKGMGWQDDWDGQVHPTFEDGQAAVRACSEAGHTCYLTECRRVEVSPDSPEQSVTAKVLGSGDSRTVAP